MYVTVIYTEDGLPRHKYITLKDGDSIHDACRRADVNPTSVYLAFYGCNPPIDGDYSVRYSHW